MSFVDITDLVNRATDEFAVGQLLKKNSFTLYETMSAIEIMDPKMDSGMRYEKPKYTYENLKDCEMSIEQVVKIIDKLQGLEVQWLKGYMIYQTLFTCLFIHDPLNVPNLYLKSYIQGLLKCCYYNYYYITMANVYMEEDFIRDSNEDELMKKLKNLKKKGSSVEASQKEDQDKEIDIINSLLSRIRFRRAFLNILINFSQSNKKNMNKIKKTLVFASTQIPIMKNTESLIKADVTDFFNENLNRKLYSQMPRVSIKYTSEETYDYYTSFFTEANYLCTLTTNASYRALINITRKVSGSKDSSTLIRSILHSIIFENNKIITDPKESKILKRMNIVDLIKEWLISFCDPIMYMESDDKDIKDMMNAFYDRCINSIVDCIRIYGYNRSRLRRLLVKFIAEWDKLQEECELLDNSLHNYLLLASDKEVNNNESQTQYYLSSWVYHIKLLYLEEYLSLGIELDIIMKHELLYTYWYLHYLYDVHEDHLERTEMLQGVSEEYKKNNIKSSNDSLEKNLSDLKLSSFTYLYEKMNISVNKYITNAYIFMFIAFRKAEICKNPECEFDKEDIRFYHRFKLFTEINSPAIVPYEVYLQNIEAIQSDNNSINNCFTYAIAEFNNAKNLLNRIKQFPDNVTQTQFYHEFFIKSIDNLLNVIQTNIENINFMSKKIGIIMKIKNTNQNIHNKKLNIHLDLDFKLNKIYPIIKLN